MYQGELSLGSYRAAVGPKSGKRNNIRFYLVRDIGGYATRGFNRGVVHVAFYPVYPILRGLTV